MKVNKAKFRDALTMSFRKRFPLSRAARKKAAAQFTGTSPKRLLAANNLDGPKVRFGDGNTWKGLVRTEFQSRRIRTRPVTRAWILKQRRNLARVGAISTANRIFEAVESRLAKAQQLIEACNPARPTVVVVVDLSKKSRAFGELKDNLVPLKEEETAIRDHFFGQYVVQSWKDGTPLHAVPLLLTGFETAVDRPQNYCPTTHANWRGALEVFADREGICTATLQLLDHILESNRSCTGIDAKLVVVHGGDVDMNELRDVVHCHYDELDAAIKSRIFNAQMVRFS